VTECGRKIVVIAGVFSSVLPVFLIGSPASARTWHIFADGSGEAGTVQAGIDSAAAGDTVLVHPGIYLERLTFRGRDIVVRSSDGPEQTILNVTGLGGRVVTFRTGESRTSGS
jgi:hypothetical protein